MKNLIRLALMSVMPLFIYGCEKPGIGGASPASGSSSSSTPATSTDAQAPAIAISDMIINEGQTLQFVLSTTGLIGAKTYYCNAGCSTTGASVVEATGIFTWTPNYTQAGHYYITVSAVDSTGMVATGTMLINVTNSNRPPTMQSVNPTILAGNTLVQPLIVSDLDGEAVSISLITGPTGLYVSGNNVIWTPNAGGAYPVTISLSDGIINVNQTFIINVTQGNRAPIFNTFLNNLNGRQAVPSSAANNRWITAKGVQVSFDVTATDPDGDNTVIAFQGTYSNAALGIAPIGLVEGSTPVTGKDMWYNYSYLLNQNLNGGYDRNLFNGRTLSLKAFCSKPGDYDLTFSATDGQLVTTKTVFLRTTDENCGNPGFSYGTTMDMTVGTDGSQYKAKNPISIVTDINNLNMTRLGLEANISSSTVNIDINQGYDMDGAVTYSLGSRISCGWLYDASVHVRPYSASIDNTKKILTVNVDPLHESIEIGRTRFFELKAIDRHGNISGSKFIKLVSTRNNTVWNYKLSEVSDWTRDPYFEAIDKNRPRSIYADSTVWTPFTNSVCTGILNSNNGRAIIED